MQIKPAPKPARHKCQRDQQRQNANLCSPRFEEVSDDDSSRSPNKEVNGLYSVDFPQRNRRNVMIHLVDVIFEYKTMATRFLSFDLSSCLNNGHMALWCRSVEHKKQGVITRRPTEERCRIQNLPVRLLISRCLGF
jgi:hypothetical protein